MLGKTMSTTGAERLVFWAVESETWLQARFQRFILHRAAGRAYQHFARQYPLWDASLFDESFVLRAATPLIQGYLNGSTPDAVALARGWAEQMWYRDEAMRQRLIAQLTPAATAFLSLLETELHSYRLSDDLRAIVGLGRTVRDDGQSDIAADSDYAAVGAQADGLLAEALREDSNVAMDWIWYASKLTRDNERRYALWRALEIDPHSELARRELHQLAHGAR